MNDIELNAFEDNSMLKMLYIMIAVYVVSIVLGFMLYAEAAG